MALKIVRATSDASETRPLRLWLQGREAEALARLPTPRRRAADDAAQLVALAIQAGERHAAPSARPSLAGTTTSPPTGS